MHYPRPVTLRQPATFTVVSACGEEAMMARGAARRDRTSASAVPASAAASAVGGLDGKRGTHTNQCVRT
eukprot:12493-Eustigmatos_ZCMA.PRE.1